MARPRARRPEGPATAPTLMIEIRRERRADFVEVSLMTTCPEKGPDPAIDNAPRSGHIPQPPFDET
jgi:hypothetical protein